MEPFKLRWRAAVPAPPSSIPEHITRRAVQDLIDGLHERCGIERAGADASLGGLAEWSSWWHHDRDLDRWADDGGRVP